ncbi:protein ITPRID1 [Discoglossus pictus]
MNVNEYMRSLHNYMETPVSRWDDPMKPVSSFPKSIPELLKLCEIDPVDLFLDLGFGTDEPDICTRIPSRFIMSPSEARGINIRVFLEAQKKRMDIENPNVCGRFRQLEVLEQVTNAFSSLLNDVHSVHNGNGKAKSDTGKKSTLTQEKRKRIQQLLWKYSKKARDLNLSSNQSPTMVETLESEVDENKPFTELGCTMDLKKSTRCIPELGRVASVTKDKVPADDSIYVLSQGQQAQPNPTQVSFVHTPLKQYNLSTEIPTKGRLFKGSKRLPKKFRRNSGQHSLQPPDSFELEEVQSFEDESPRPIFSNSISDGEIRRTNSCQSDSSGFQEEPTEPLPLQNLHESLNLSSDSIDSQATLMGNIYSTPFQEDSTEDYEVINPITLHEEHEDCVRSPLNAIVQAKKVIPKLSSINTTTNEDVFQSFESQNNDFNVITHETDEPELEPNQAQKDFGSDNGEFVNDVSLMKEHEHEEQVDTDTSEIEFPVYITHYLSKNIESYYNAKSGEVHEGTVQHNLDTCVSEFCKVDNTENNQLTDTEIDDCLDNSKELLEATWTPPQLKNHCSSRKEALVCKVCNKLTINDIFASETPAPDDYVVDDAEPCQKDKKSTFQTEVTTKIYKSVTIQMSSNLSNTNTSEVLSRQHSFYNNKADRKFNLNEHKKESFSQTDMETWDHSNSSSHSKLHRSCYSTESLSFDRGLYSLHHPPHQQIPICTYSHCCLSCHHHHCYCSRFPSACKHNKTKIEQELTETLKLLKESLTAVSMHSDHDLEHMKKACQRFKDKLTEIEQLLTEQQAGCWTTFSSEGWEEIRRLHLLRRSVLQEVTELEFRLDERAWHVKEALSKQLDQVLEEQSRLYSELDFSNGETERRRFNLKDYKQSMKSSTASAPASYEDISQDIPKHTPTENENKEQSLPQKVDFRAFLKNIKKSFRSFNNS